MKIKTFSTILAIGLIVNLFGQKSTMELTFTAKEDGLYIPLDSIIIENITLGLDTIIHAPDTILVLDYVTSIGDNNVIMENEFTVSQNYPNPFIRKTEINLTLQEEDKIKLAIRDIIGIKQAEYEFNLNMGNHSFTFYPGNEKYYLLTVSGKNTSKTIKMLNSNSNSTKGGKCKLIYSNCETSGFKSRKVISSFIFNLGDELRYIGYAKMVNEVIGSSVIEDSPQTNENYIFEIIEGVPCPSTPIVTDADGNVYNTVQIGEQCWMKENLRVGAYINGSVEMTNNNTIEKYCYDDIPANCDTYGGLYQWTEMMQYTSTQGVQGICPTGWHLPTDNEWKTMEIQLGMSQYAADATGWRGIDEGGKMKSKSGWNYNGNGTNSSGLSALPGGDRYSSGSFYNHGNHCRWWSSSEYSSTIAWIRSLNYEYNSVYRTINVTTFGFGVRCLKDN